MPGITIRLATEEDAAALPDIERSAGAAFLAIFGLEWVAGDAVMSGAHHQIYIDDGTVWIALSGSRRIGFVTTARHGDALHIVELSVESGYQGHGVGRRLLPEAPRRPMLRLRQVAGDASDGLLCDVVRLGQLSLRVG